MIKHKWLFFVLPLVLSACLNNNQGQKIPSFKATTLQSVEINTEQLLGKVIVLKIWATWCGPCIAEINQLNQLVEKYQDNKQVVFIAITDEETNKIRLFLNRNPFLYQQIASAKDIKLLFQPMPYKEIPKHIVVDKQGMVVFDKAGTQPHIAQDLDLVIQSLLQN
jgi:thiol-disulfide isomerase/thioredoxin